MRKADLTELTKRVDEILYYIWDPIGVSDTPACRNEYSSYTATIVKCVLKDDLKKIVAQLNKLELTSIGLKPNEVKNLEVAKLLLDSKYTIEEVRK
jgi:hypothetical protein